jgi:hypothetical protein
MWVVKMPLDKTHFQWCLISFWCQMLWLYQNWEEGKKIRYQMGFSFFLKHGYKNKGYNGMWIMDPKGMHVRNEIVCAHDFLQPLSSNN